MLNDMTVRKKKETEKGVGGYCARVRGELDVTGSVERNDVRRLWGCRWDRFGVGDDGWAGSHCFDVYAARDSAGTLRLVRLM